MPCLRQESDTAKPFADFFKTLHNTVFRFFKQPTNHPHETQRELGEETRTPKHFANDFFAIAREPSLTEAEGLSLSLKNDSPAAFRSETESVSFQGVFFSSSLWVVLQSTNKLQLRKPPRVKTAKRRNTRANTHARACRKERWRWRSEDKNMAALLFRRWAETCGDEQAPGARSGDFSCCPLGRRSTLSPSRLPTLAGDLTTTQRHFPAF